MRKHVRAMKKYSVGEASIPGHTTVINLASNEKPALPSAAVLAALQSSWHLTNRYADSSYLCVIEALSHAYAIPPDNLICGNGSAELIFLLAEAYATEGDEILIWKYGYQLYEVATKRVGATIVKPVSAEFVDVSALLKVVTTKTKLIFIDNPNNPTGAYISISELRELRLKLPDDILLVIDAAYAEYVTAQDYEDGLMLAKECNNVCILRTFSKCYGLAGFRLGWMYGPVEIVNALKSLQQPASVCTAAQLAAVAALNEREHLTAIREQNSELRNQLAKDILALGVKSYPSEANFILLDLLSPTLAKRVFVELKQYGIIVRPMAAYQLENCLRITIGTPAEMATLTSALNKILS